MTSLSTTSCWEFSLVLKCGSFRFASPDQHGATALLALTVYIPQKIILFPPTFCHSCLPGLSPLNHTPWLTRSKTPPLRPAQTNNGNLIITVLEMAVIPMLCPSSETFSLLIKSPPPAGPTWPTVSELAQTLPAPRHSLCRNLFVSPERPRSAEVLFSALRLI